MIDDTCDYCRRDFGREPGAAAICLNCGLENVRIPDLDLDSNTVPWETATFAGAPERAMKPAPRTIRLDAVGVPLSSGVGKATIETTVSKRPVRRKRR